MLFPRDLSILACWATSLFRGSLVESLKDIRDNLEIDHSHISVLLAAYYSRRVFRLTGCPILLFPYILSHVCTKRIPFRLCACSLFGCHPQSGDIPNTLDFSTKNGIDHNAVIGALKSLVADNFVVMEAEDHESYKLMKEGEAALKDGSPEAQIFKLVSLYVIIVCLCVCALMLACLFVCM